MNQELQRKLADKIDDETYDRIKKLFNNLDKCPTCNGKKRYVLDSKTHTCDCDTQKLLQRHYYAANIGRSYHTLSLDHFVGTDSKLLKEAIVQYLDDWENNRYCGMGLTFDGGVGTGKTFAMSYILKELLKKGNTAFFISFDELVNIFGSAWNNDEAKYLNLKLRSVDILGIDELKTDSRNGGGFLSQAAENIVRHRASNLLPTLITTNLDAAKEEELFAKSYSLLSSLNRRITTQGSDVRGNMIRTREFEMRDRGERRPVC